MPVLNDWIGVDLDGTLARDDAEWSGPLCVGAPILSMVDRIHRWRRNGVEVRIVTARMGTASLLSHNVTAAEMRAAIQRWCADYVGEALPVTAEKDIYMLELWDDRAVTVEHNTGRVLTRGMV